MEFNHKEMRSGQLNFFFFFGQLKVCNCKLFLLITKMTPREKGGGLNRYFAHEGVSTFVYFS